LNCPGFTNPPTQTRVLSLTGNLSFGSVIIGSSKTKLLTITNNGNSTLTIGTISLPTRYTSDYTSGTISAGGSTTANITFNPQSTTTNYNGTITVSSNATSGTNTFSVTGSGGNNTSQTRIISLSGNLTFGNVLIGNTPSKPLTIANSGNSTLTINSISLPNGYSSDYNSGTISSGNSTTANITFSPQNTVTNYNGTITVNSNSTSGTNTINISGSGINGTPPNPTFNPLIGTYTGCSFSNQIGSGNCAGSTYLGSTIHMKVASYSQSTNTINFTIEKCSGSFSNSGTAYIKQGDYCGSLINQTNYAVGASLINLSVTPPLAAGSYTYTAVLVSATTDKYYTLSINVQY
jgi:hypothetical protein